MKMRPEEKRRLVRLLIIVGVSLTAGIAYYFAVSALGGGIPCPIYTATGIYCPGCGITRMFMSLFSGDIVSAIKYNALVMALLPLGMFFGVRWSAEYVREGRLGKMKTADKIAVLIVLVLTVVFCVLRNTEAFSFLSPAF